MFAVDCIGVEAVVKMISTTGLKKFIIYRHNAAKGSTPIYEFTDGNQNHIAQKAFKDWAMNMNPNSGSIYEILLFNKEGYVETEASVRKQDKIRFSFALSSSFGGGLGSQQSPQIDIAAEVAKALNDYDQKKTIEALKQRIEELENGDDDEDEPDIVEKINGIMQMMDQKKQSAVINGNFEDTETKMNGQQKQISPETLRIKKALGRLKAQDPQYIEDLERLALLAEQNPKLFKNVIGKLRLIVVLK